MALNATVLADLIQANVEAATGNSMPAISQIVWQAVADAIVTHIITAAVVTSAVTVVSVSLVTPGMGASGPGAGTATGNIT